MGPDPESVTVHEALERDFFYRPPRQVMCQAAVVDDVAAADVDAMMSKAKTRCDEVRARRWLFVRRQESVMLPEPDEIRTRPRRNSNIVREHTLILELAAGNAASL